MRESMESTYSFLRRHDSCKAFIPIRIRHVSIRYIWRDCRTGRGHRELGSWLGVIAEMSMGKLGHVTIITWLKLRFWRHGWLTKTYSSIKTSTVNSCTVVSVCSGCGREKWVCHWHWGKRKAASNHWRQREVASDFSFECTSTLGDHLIPSCSWFSSDISCSARKASSLTIVVVDSLQPQLLFLLPI